MENSGANLAKDQWKDPSPSSSGNKEDRDTKPSSGKFEEEQKQREANQNQVIGGNGAPQDEPYFETDSGVGSARSRKGGRRAMEVLPGWVEGVVQPLAVKEWSAGRSEEEIRW